MLLRHYRRADKLKLLDVGVGSCVGTSLLAMLHSDNFVYSTLQIDAVDYTPMRERWVRTQYPKINYRVADVFDLPERSWDLVVCSHVVEHVAEPRPFIDALRRICSGFAFVYSPFAETDRIGEHQSTITDETYAGIPGCQLEHIKSMGWHPDRPDDQCLLAIIDCGPRLSPHCPARHEMQVDTGQARKQSLGTGKVKPVLLSACTRSCRWPRACCDS